MNQSIYQSINLSIIQFIIQSKIEMGNLITNHSPLCSLSRPILRMPTKSIPSFSRGKVGWWQAIKRTSPCPCLLQHEWNGQVQASCHWQKCQPALLQKRQVTPSHVHKQQESLDDIINFCRVASLIEQEVSAGKTEVLAPHR